MVVEMVGYSGLSTEHQEVGSFTCAGVRCATVSPHYLRQHHIPLLLTAVEEETTEGVAQYLVVAFHYSVSLWVVWSGPAFVYPPEMAEVTQQLRLKLSPLVRM